ncbi:DUF2288 domain-containing protein [Gammaproteobacteria bacterium]|nr:DUF2288 domain-containing protein [Gammaproteobacteria bacterium]
MSALETLIAEERARINGETAQIAWRDLQRFFAAGRVIVIDPQLDLVEVARLMNLDDSECIARWVKEELIQAVADEQAKDWYESDKALWSVVIKPWILVQAAD